MTKKASDYDIQNKLCYFGGGSLFLKIPNTLWKFFFFFFLDGISLHQLPQNIYFLKIIQCENKCFFWRKKTPSIKTGGVQKQKADFPFSRSWVKYLRYFTFMVFEVNAYLAIENNLLKKKSLPLFQRDLFWYFIAKPKDTFLYEVYSYWVLFSFFFSPGRL